MEGYDVYNPTAPFEYEGKTVLIGRVEKRDSENAESVFFIKQNDGSFTESAELPRYTLQDPFITKIGDTFVFGGTKIFPHPQNPDNLWWKTSFYYGKKLNSLKKLTDGPNGMKDIRLVELKNGKIGVFTRPQGAKGGRGTIGFTIINNLEELNDLVISQAKLLQIFISKDWCGVNETRLLPSGNIGVLGHVARYSKRNVRHYYPFTFVFNATTSKIMNLKIIAERSVFLDGPSKRLDLVDVLFSAGLISENNGKATLYVGASDCEIQSVLIDYPFA